MKRSRFSEEQVIAILKQHEGGVSTADVCREHGISSATFYNEPSKAPLVRAGRRMKAKFGGMEVSNARKLRALEDENAKLKRLLAEQMLDNAMLKGPPCLAAIGPRPMADASRKW